MYRNFFPLLFLVSVLLLFPLTGRSQSGKFEMGFSAGLTYNELSTQPIRPLSKYEAGTGFSVSVPLQFAVTNWFGIAADLSCIQKNYEWKHSTFAYQTTKNTYIQLPVMLRFSLGKKQFKLFANAGGFGGYWVNCRLNGKILNVFDTENAYSYSEKYAFDQRKDQRFELGISAGLGLEYILKTQYRFFVEARYYRGMTDLQKDYMINQIPRYNDAYLFQMGCLFNLRNIKNRRTVNPVPQAEPPMAIYTEEPTEIILQDTAIVEVITKVDTVKITTNPPIEEPIKSESSENSQEVQNREITEVTETITKGNYYIQLFVLKEKRAIPDIENIVHILKKDSIVMRQKGNLFIYSVGAFSKKEAEEKLEHYKKYVPDAFVTKL